VLFKKTFEKFGRRLRKKRWYMFFNLRDGTSLPSYLVALVILVALVEFVDSKGLLTLMALLNSGSIIPVHSRLPFYFSSLKPFRGRRQRKTKGALYI
jgi:hypothetical protein